MTTRSIRISVRGKPVYVPCLEVEGRTIIVTGRLPRIAKIFDDFLDSRGVENPDSIIKTIKQQRKADLFTFLGRFTDAVLPEKPKVPVRYTNHIVYEYEAVIHVVSFEHWWKNDINKKTRRNIRKAKKENVNVCVVRLDDKLIRGIDRIFNETPIRQGKQFWHYGKKFDQIKREISTYANESIFLGAYFKNELIGFAKLINCGDFGRANQILSMMAHRDKPVTNALIAELVRTCERNNIPYLKYGAWLEGSLGDFKRNNGFKKLVIPRYYTALTLRGKVALGIGIDKKGVRGILPNSIRNGFIQLRNKWYKRVTAKL